MDPIHPIVPVPPQITPVLPTPLIGRIDRDNARRQAEQEKRRRRPASSARPDGSGHHAGNASEDDTGTHVDVTA